MTCSNETKYYIKNMVNLYDFKNCFPPLFAFPLYEMNELSWKA